MFISISKTVNVVLCYYKSAKGNEECKCQNCNASFSFIFYKF